MKRVLIITYYWPPSGGSGVQRWLKFAKYLPEFGWQPVVVAPEGADYPVIDESLMSEVGAGVEVLRYPIREPYAAYRRLTGAGPGDVKAGGGGQAGGGSPGLMKRFANWVRANFFVPDPRVWWVRPTARSLEAYLAAHPVDVLVTTGPPHSVHLIGLSLKRALPELPWVVDVRDPWSQFDVHLAFNPGKRAREKNRRYERACLRAADVVLGTSPSMPEHLEAFDRGKYVCVTNGYDAADFAGFDESAGFDEIEDTRGQSRHVGSDDEAFAVYHTGLLSANRNPGAVWKALAELCAEDGRFAERLDLRLVGTVDEYVVADIETHPALRARYTVTPWVPHGELMAHYRRASMFLLCPNLSHNARSQINGKLFEYLAARRPILHVGPFDADNTRILDAAHAGLTVLPGDVDGARDAIVRIYGGSFGESPHAFAGAVIRGYERRAVAGRLGGVLDQLNA